ncbi:MAG: substrate-binding domain-containing protein [Burkholderiaceae bacterium]
MHPRLNLRRLAATALPALALAFGAATASAKDLKVGLLYSGSGPLEAYGKQTATGFALGLEYATNGTMTVGGRKLVVIEKDTQGKPDLGRALLTEAYADDGVEVAVGPTSSGVALAMLPIAAEYEKILIVEPAVADVITGEKWNKYIFRTSRNSTQDAISNAVAIDQDNTSIATLAQDYAFGRDGVAAFKDALKKAKIVHEEYLPAKTTDFTAGAQRLFDALKDKPGRKIIFIIWAGGNPFKIADLEPGRYGIEISSGGNILPALAAYKAFPGMEGSIYYYYEIPKNKANDWLVAEHQKRFGSPPDFFTAGGMSAAMALVSALEKTDGKTDADTMIPAMEGMSFDTPKGTMTFRKEDHQAMQSMYHFKIKVDDNVKWAIPELVREIKADEMDIPIRNKR